MGAVFDLDYSAERVLDAHKKQMEDQYGVVKYEYR
jgi:hypothetical protein